MNWLQRVAKWYLGKSQLTNKDDWFYEWLIGGNKSAAGIVVSPTKALHDVAVMACVSIRAQDFAKLPVHVYRRRKDGGKDIIKNHALEVVLRKPNAWQTRFEFLEQMHVAYLLEGNAYAAIMRDGRARITGMAPLTAVQTWPSGTDLYYRPTPNNEFERAILKAFPEVISGDDMLHLKWMSRDILYGQSRVGLSRNAIGLDLALEQSYSQTFSRGAQIAGILKTEKKLAEETFKRLKSQWNKYEGVSGEKSGGTPLLEEGLSFEKVAMTMVEAQAVEARRAQFEQIATAFDVPLHRLGIVPEGQSSQIIVAHQQYLNNTLSTDAVRWQAKLQDAFDLDGETEFVEFDLDYFNEADVQTRMNAHRTAIVGMVKTPNEVRREEGLPDVDGGDVVYQPTNVAPLGFEPAGDETGPGSDVTGKPAEGGDGDPAAVQDEDKKQLNGHAIQ